MESFKSSKQRKAEEQRVARFGDLAEPYLAARASLAWNTVYDPVKNRVITPVSRTWCSHGWVLFEWDTYFAAYMCAVDNPELAMANAITTPGRVGFGFYAFPGGVSNDHLYVDYAVLTTVFVTPTLF